MIPSSIYTGISNLLAGIVAAAPLAQAPTLTLQSLSSQAAELLDDIQTELADKAGNLDAPDPTGYPGNMVSDLIKLRRSSADQATLCAMYGLVGRAAFNLSQASG